MIRFDAVSWHAGAFRLDAVSFTVPAGSYGVLMGRTGCGKTTLLEILCGLRRPAGGRVFIGERDVTDLPRASAASATCRKTGRCSPP